MGRKKGKRSVQMVAAAGMALALNAAEAVVIDGAEGIGDRVWNDVNMDGLQDGLESGIPGVQVNLYDAGNVLLDSEITDGLGEYYFNLDPIAGGSGGFNMDFIVEFILPAGFVFSPAMVGADPTIDSNADPITGRTGLINITDFENDLTVDAGMYQPSSVVPAPAGAVLIATGLALLGWRRRGPAARQ